MRYGMVIDLNTCAGCAACVMACKQGNATPAGEYWCGLNIWEEGKYPDARKRVMPHACMHCKNAPCVKACPTGASHYAADGTVQVDYDKCIGCRMCMGACPYNARQFNWGDPSEQSYYEGFEQTPYEAMRASEHPKGVVEKCILCSGRLEEGKQPLCVKTCITKCRTFGDLDDPNSEVSRKIKELNARPLMEDLGTEPSIYYAGL